MKRRLILNFSLLLLLLASCAPAAVTEASVQSTEPAAVEPSATPFAPSEPTLTAPAEEVIVLPTETLAPTPLPVATSRGPDLHATDPRTVNLASGQLQFVEFFRFT